MTENVHINVDGINLCGFYQPPTSGFEDRHCVLIIHGAAKTGNPIDYLSVAQSILAQKGIGSLVVHLRGVGEKWAKSEGDYNTSLMDRIPEITAGIDFLHQQQPNAKLHIVACSMNAETVILALEKIKCEIESISLISPAAYPAGAELVPLGDEFSQIIRSDDKDLTSSPVWIELIHYHGRLFIAYGDCDDVIDEIVRNMYLMQADISFIAKKMDHHLVSSKDSPEFVLMYNLIAQMIDCL